MPCENSAVGGQVRRQAGAIEPGDVVTLDVACDALRIENAKHPRNADSMYPSAEATVPDRTAEEAGSAPPTA